MCPGNCKACTVKTDGSSTCDTCNTNYYLNGKVCTNADCYGTDGKSCTKCIYGKALKDGKCTDCLPDFSCPASCVASAAVQNALANANITTNGTDSGSGKIAFSFLVLAFFAILGNMMI
jgi:hypothetical protein